MEKRITQAVVLAAGEGQRLKPFTRLIPKAMLPIAERPILQHVIEALADNGVRRIVMVIGYRKEQIQDYFGSGKDFGVEIDYVLQPQQLGTAHALKMARDRVDDRFLVVNGDNVIGRDAVAPMIAARSTTMLISPRRDVSRYGAVLVKDGRVQQIIEKPAEAVSLLANTGAYALEKNVFDYLDEEVELTVVIQKMIDAGHTVMVHQTDRSWLDVVYPWDMLTLNEMALQKTILRLGGTIEDGVTLKGAVVVGDGAVIRSGSYIVGPVRIGENCDIGPHVCIFPSTSIGRHVTISPFSVIKNCVIGYDVNVGSGTFLEDTVIAPGVNIGSYFSSRSGEATINVEGEYHQVKMGSIIGSGVELADHVIAEPGVILGNFSRIRALKVIRENVPDDGLVM